VSRRRVTDSSGPRHPSAAVVLQSKFLQDPGRLRDGRACTGCDVFHRPLTKRPNLTNCRGINPYWMTANAMRSCMDYFDSFFRARQTLSGVIGF
jgi:hypothetical protein